jgi:hypothetical protein
MVSDGAVHDIAQRAAACGRSLCCCFRNHDAADKGIGWVESRRYVTEDDIIITESSEDKKEL